jgi:hypothetical protein
MSRYPFGVLVLLAAGLAPAAEKELHVVALYEGHQAVRDRTRPGTAAVTVDRPGKDVVLVVQAYDPVTWEVRATPKTTLTKVLALGYYRQTVVAANGVVIEELTYYGKQAGVSTTYVYGHYDIEGVRFRPFIRKLFDQTGLEVTSFQGAYQFDPKMPFVVDAVQKDERLRSDFPKLTPAAQLPKIKFDATRLFDTGRGMTAAAFGEFTQAGPNNDALTVLPKGMLQVAYDPGAKRYYGITGHELHSVDVKGGTSQQIDSTLAKKPNWLRALTYDTKRERVIISGRNAMYEYVTKGNGNWSVLVDGRKGSFNAIAWQKSTDTLFALGNEGTPSDKQTPTLYELTVAGAVAKKTALGFPTFPGVLGGDHGLQGRAELIDLGADLAVVIHNDNRDTEIGERGKPEAFLYVIDPKTGKVKLAWKE